MRSSKCISSTAAALHCIFIAPIEQSQFQFARRATPIRSTARQSHLFHTTSHRARWVSAVKADRVARLPRDEEITAWNVILVGADNKLSPPISPMDILQSIDRNKESLVVVVKGENGDLPVCKIMNKEKMRAAEKDKAKRERKSGGATSTKTIELNWAIDANDLDHRIRKMKGFLGKGYKVEVILAAKRKGRKATLEEATGVVKNIKSAIAEVEGARENKAMDGKILETATFFIEGKLQKSTKKEASGLKDEREEDEDNASDEASKEENPRNRRKRWQVDGPALAK